MANTWKRYEVAVHGYGRRLITRDGPAQGLLEWPAHTWSVISTRPMGLRAAVALADAQAHHAVVNLWMDAQRQTALVAGWLVSGRCTTRLTPVTPRSTTP